MKKLSDQIIIDKIKPSPYQPRLTFDLEDIRGSIQKDGILVPLTVREKDGYYELIDGERRLRVARELGIGDIPIQVIDVDDETAMGMVWAVNTERKDYSLQEKVRYATILQQQKISIEAIAHKMRYSRCMVRNFLNVNKLPEKYQKLLWQNVKGISIAHIDDLASFFNGNIATALKHLDLSLERKLNQNEFEAYLNPELEKIERKRVESAKKAVGKITTELKEPKTPEELEKAAEALKREAKKKRESKLSSEEKIKREADKQRKKEEQKRKREEKKRKEEEQRKKREEKIRLEAELKAKQQARRELLEDMKFLSEAAKTFAEKQKTTKPPKDILKDLGIPSVRQQIEDFYKKLPPRKPSGETEINRESLILHIKILAAPLKCPICGETQIIWKCGHEFK